MLDAALRTGSNGLGRIALNNFSFLLFCCIAAVACDRPTCLGLYPASQDRNAPELLHMELMPQQTQNPWTLLFAVDFKDRDGDVADGNMLVYVGASTPVVMPLADAFAVSELPKEATSGRFGFPLFVGQGAVPSETTLRMGFQLEDARSHHSNCYAVDLFYTVTLPTRAQEMGPQTVPAWRVERVACP